MTSRNFLIAIFMSLLSPLAVSQPSDYEPPRAPDGHPDLQGTFTFRTLTPMQRPTELGERSVLTEEEAAEWTAFENRRQNRDLIIDSVGGAQYPPGVISYNEFWYERGDNTVVDRRTSLIVDPPDGRIPALTEEALQRRRDVSTMRELSLGPEARPYAERCIVTRTSGPPMQPGSYNLNVQFVQTSAYFMIMNEMIHNVRVVRMNKEHRDGPLMNWEGDSVGHWEGDTLVVDTVNFWKGTAFADSTSKMHLVEKFTRTGPDSIQYQFTIEDPTTWIAPWTAVIPMRSMDQPIYEYACHEGNYGFHGVMAGIRRLQLEADQGVVR
ncbi:MAG TPA: hypothetical protein DCF95_09645 [Gammaproteobacteria bacterium]|nr:hypothetical protein [Gammaproteobacteria bacterium]|tara:strand:- start:2088 stop:3059 length:972 start_codon:yes stop_codon:yes gene_type:complete